MAAYTIFFIMVIIITIGLFAIAGNIAINEFIGAINPFISTGEVSSQFSTFWGYALGLWMLFPIFGLLFLFIWAVVRAIERKQQEGGY